MDKKGSFPPPPPPIALSGDILASKSRCRGCTDELSALAASLSLLFPQLRLLVSELRRLEISGSTTSEGEGVRGVGKSTVDVKEFNGVG